MVQKLVQRPNRYLIQRAGNYYMRIVVPPRIRLLNPQIPREVKKSLKTDSKRQAIALVASRDTLIQRFQSSQDPDQALGLYQALVAFDDESQPIVTERISPASALCSGPRLSEVWASFSQWKVWTPKARKDNERMYENLEYFAGDIPVGLITKTILNDVLTAIAALPKRNCKPYNEMRLDELAELDDVPEAHLVSGKYVRGHLKLFQGLFNSYLVREVALLETSPTEGLTWKYSDNRYASFSDAQINSLLLASGTRPEWFQWFIRLAIYSGARRSEIANLRKTSFRFDPDSQRHYIMIAGGKTDAAKRQIPIHRRLLEFGLLDWLRESDDLLFPVPAANPNRATEHFKLLLPEDINDFGERYVFHSLRHTFITKARSKGVTDVLLQQVVGHEKRGAGITDRYTHTFPLSSVLLVVDSLDY
ncbi:tyrosine-type recombinase/integrase [Thalassolituus oleivorans]|uniref:tyrosine-type recombinase/integrase n=1 Tax=Thalassolituus oleivorans TaxID=187493 RepID=UPI00042DBD7D|nr:tyrosine-type recombinase/integrase [Thalassolituus oleivorans]AHK17757.1 hypothetical protein R615_13125 [Thalassolituus oleivorans R6-15]